MRRFTPSAEDGFTLIELLVVVLIIGILAAIAVPTFLGQTKKAQDASAKSNVGGLVTHVESCYLDTNDYSGCVTNAELGTTGLNLIDGGATMPGLTAGQVSVAAVSTAPDSYTITAKSDSGTEFSIVKVAGGAPSHTCSASAVGGCKTGGTW